ncbi:MAG: hypothetical protein D6800_03920, partial [Candidatus Zixiibacteriota bacterium]
MEVLQLIDTLRHLDKKPGGRPKPKQPLDEYAGLTPEQLRRMFRTMLTARRVEREEKLLLRKGYNRFFIGCGGKELIDVVLAENARKDDPFVGYYRNKA